jgi:cyclase
MTNPLVALSLVVCGTLVVSSQSLPAPASVPVLHVQKSVYMLPAATGNITVQIGDDGVMLVDTGTPALAPSVIAAVRTLSNKPIHTIVNTHLHVENTGGNQALLKLRGPQAVRVMGHENTFNRMMDAAAAANAGIPQAALPMNTYFTPRRDFFLNGEAIVLHHAAAAHTDGDTIVHFRGSDVVSTGDIFTPGLYPAIDLPSGGTINGLITSLNQVLEITVPAKYQEGGTYVIPGRGRLCDEADVVEYRDMVTIVRDRVQDLMRKKMTLQQVKNARPSRDYDGEYGSPDAFIEAAFRSLGGK